MNVSVSALADLRSHVDAERGALLKTVINSTSVAEAGVALGMLSENTSQQTLVAALNLRGILQDLPESPFAMGCDFVTLQSVADMERRGQSWVKRLGDDDDAPELELLGQGNLCYDMVVRAGKTSSFLKPGPVDEDFVPDTALDLIMEEIDLLRTAIELTQEMGVVQNPRFYLSVEDWQMEHAAETLEGLQDFF